jgi:hypothetical protein
MHYNKPYHPSDVDAGVVDDKDWLQPTTGMLLTSILQKQIQKDIDDDILSMLMEQENVVSADINTNGVLTVNAMVRLPKPVEHITFDLKI